LSIKEAWHEDPSFDSHPEWLSIRSGNMKGQRKEETGCLMDFLQGIHMIALLLTEPPQAGKSCPIHPPVRFRMVELVPVYEAASPPRQAAGNRVEAPQQEDWSELRAGESVRGSGGESGEGMETRGQRSDGRTPSTNSGNVQRPEKTGFPVLGVKHKAP